ncbi:MAG: DNA mismatch repair protein MutS [Bacteroidia bacterium]|nr:DNA mismatch repair protein MutS [Bacteroidia bacterium]
MKIKVGDEVTVLDEDLTGIVKAIKDGHVIIETKDGFDLDFSVSEVIKIKSSTNLAKEAFTTSSVKDVISEKESFKKKRSTGIKPKERTQPAMEVDLHIHQLTNSTRGMTNHDMKTLQLETAKRQLEFAIRKKIQRVVFIHGVGDGVLKLELQYLFGRYNNVKYYDANLQKYGLGATEVYIYQNADSN